MSRVCRPLPGYCLRLGIWTKLESRDVQASFFGLFYPADLFPRSCVRGRRAGEVAVFRWSQVEGEGETKSRTQSDKQHYVERNVDS